MGENSKLLKQWFASQPSKVDNAVIMQMFKVFLWALQEQDGDIAQLKAEIEALSAALAVAENQYTILAGRVTVTEQDIKTLKG